VTPSFFEKVHGAVPKRQFNICRRNQELTSSNVISVGPPRGAFHREPRLLFLGAMPTALTRDSVRHVPWYRRARLGLNLAALFGVSLVLWAIILTPIWRAIR